MKPKLLLGLALVVGSTLISCSTNPPNPAAGLPLRYHNAQYDFTFFLPASWKGYSVRLEQWNSNQADVMVAEQGPIIVLRHPRWKTNDLYQDIPIMVFTRKQWNEEQRGEFFPYAGGVISEMWHNREYVFGEYSRYNADDSVKSWKEADDIINQNRATHPEPALYPRP